MLTVTTPSEHEILFTRTFDAPRTVVFSVMTDAAHVPHWWGRRGHETSVERLDLRPGGAWRFVQRAPDGREFAFRGEYREVVPPSRLVYTFEYEGNPGRVSIATLTFDERGGKTTLTNRLVFEDVEQRDAAIEAGMQGGASESMDKLEARIRELQPLR